MPDGWQRLWAPHRLDYLRGENRPLVGNDVECPFCRWLGLDAGFTLTGQQTLQLDAQRQPRPAIH